MNDTTAQIMIRCESIAEVARSIDRADHTTLMDTDDMGIDHRGIDVVVPEQLLDVANIRTRCEKSCRKRISKRMAAAAYT